MKNTTLISFFIFIIHFSQAQIWEGHAVHFPSPTQGWRITPANDTVAWTFGFVINTDLGFVQNDYSYSRTTDGGNTWTNSTFPGIQTDGYFCSIFADGPDKAWITFVDYAEGGKIFYTINGGEDWDILNTPVQDVFVSSIHFFDQDHGVIWGDPIDSLYAIFTTADGGVTWEQVDESNMPPAIDNDEWTIAGNVGVNGDHIWFDTYYNRVFYSADKGRTWTVWDNPSATHYGLDLKADEDNNLYFILAGENPEGETTFELYRRHPDENDWTNLTPEDNRDYISGFSPVPGTNTLIINLPDETRVSYDHGESWLTIDVDTTFIRGYNSFVNAQIGYCCQIPESYDNPSQNVYKYIGTPLTGLLHPQPIDVTMSVTPNPAHDQIQLSIAGPQAEDYWVLIHDLNGRLMYKSESTQQTVLMERIDISTWTNGVYSLTVSNRNGLRSETFVKL